VGRYDGLAAWLLREARIEHVEEPRGDAPLGIRAGSWDAAVLDLYEAEEDELCELAHALPTATIADSRRCTAAGIVVDYHLDRSPAESTTRLLAGSRYAPLDPRLVALRERSGAVARALVTVGATRHARELLPALIDGVERSFPGIAVRVSAGGGVPPATSGSLIEILPGIDIAVSAAGFTAYELACAGIPAVVVAIVENQRRVAAACEQAGVAIGIDALDGSLARLEPALLRLHDARLRSRMSAAGRTAFDGRGAARTALSLERLWKCDRP
jgi:spore coat polysaccharide biosynthesis predicted glycosyltransferase SpsG